ncbi:aldo/keto reductase [Trypanosoma rangeli]|uniref:Aldo/keto reductase n=1 Tax=Trypanosoma rangeli TaxID=5698 RepID=A0A3R7KJ04_TRYRA|nr:aldo/keto reductase [Trypanosoma rangeli]RNF08532.1 aldo/keto reductase [Trypanosoma rangeli]|eukprot:RNF08532.1 aldo/keto reductase [Trypanosoma rangeli]
MRLKSDFRISDLSDDQLARLNLRSVSKASAAALSPDWLEAFFTNVAYNTKFECIGVLLLEGFHTLFDGRPEAHVDEDILQLFAYLEKQVGLGVLRLRWLALRAFDVSVTDLVAPFLSRYAERGTSHGVRARVAVTLSAALQHLPPRDVCGFVEHVKRVAATLCFGRAREHLSQVVVVFFFCSRCGGCRTLCAS